MQNTSNSVWAAAAQARLDLVDALHEEGRSDIQIAEALSLSLSEVSPAVDLEEAASPDRKQNNAYSDVWARFWRTRRAIIIALREKGMQDQQIADDFIKNSEHVRIMRTRDRSLDFKNID